MALRRQRPRLTRIPPAADRARRCRAARQEASGRITPATAGTVAASGVDLISAGSLHRATGGTDPQPGVPWRPLIWSMRMRKYRASSGRSLPSTMVFT
ncbi:MAG: hypothetical protein EBY18_12705 [Alphaproteobacteria bacterium]|nr:hypothetical protein [Alphaproteobacteria bacterium]